MSEIKFHNNNNCFSFFLFITIYCKPPPPSPQFCMDHYFNFYSLFPSLTRNDSCSRGKENLSLNIHIYHSHHKRCGKYVDVYILERKCHSNGFHWIKTKTYWEILRSIRNMFSFIMLLNRACSQQKSLNLVTIEQVLLNLQTGRPPIGTRRSLPKIVKKIGSVLWNWYYLVHWQTTN